MNICKRSNGYSRQTSWPDQGGYTRPPVVRSISHALCRFVAALHASLIVARKAEYRYALSDQELDQIGLSREDVVAELLRAIYQHEDED